MTIHSLLIGNPYPEVSSNGRVQNAALYRSIRHNLRMERSQLVGLLLTYSAAKCMVTTVKFLA